MIQKPLLVLEQIEIGPMGNFVYFLGDRAKGEIAVVDPAWDVKFLLTKAKKENLTIVAGLLTHGHHDHANGVEQLVDALNVPVYISQHEASFYTPKCKNLKKTQPGENLKIGNLEITCIHTPGHTPGCQCFLAQGNLLTGDTLFIGGCGRCDLPGGDARKMYHSLYNVIVKLPDSTVIYSGHGYGDNAFDTLGSQKKTNPYLQCSNLEEFLTTRMGL